MARTTGALPKLSGPTVGRWLKIDPYVLLLGLLVGAMGFVVLYPAAVVILNSVTLSETGQPGVYGFDAWVRAFSEPGMVRAIGNTFKVVLATQAIAFPAAIAIAWLLARTDVPFNGPLEFGFWILYFLPALSTTTGWLILFDPSVGYANKVLIDLGLVTEAPFNMYSFWGIVFAHLTTYSIGVKVMLLTPAFRNLDASIEEASRLCGAGGLRTVIRVVIPVLTPAILVAFLMSFIRSLEAFEIELFLGIPADFAVYSTKIYQLLASEPSDFAGASVLATVVLLLVVPLLFVQRWASTRRSFVTVTGQYRRQPVQLGRWRWPVFALLVSLVLGMSVMPLLLQLTGSFMKLFGVFEIPEVWTLNHWRETMADTTVTRGIGNSLVLGAGTAAGAVVIYSICAYCAVRVKTRLGAAIDILSWLPLTLPGIVVGLGYLWMVLKVPVFEPLYGTMSVLILVSLISSMTIGVQVLKGQFLQLGADVEEAGRIVGGSWIRTFRSILVPLITPAIAVMGIIVFTQTIRHVSNIILLATGDIRPLAILQLDFLSASEMGPATVVGTVIVGIALAAAGAVRLLTRHFGVHGR